MAFSSFGAGFVVGFGTGFVSREALPLIRDFVRPISRITLKGALMLFESTREAASRVSEMAEDIYAEVKEEIKKDKNRKKRLKRKPTIVTEVERTA